MRRGVRDADGGRDCVYGQRRLRPLARRADRILRPSAVAIRARKPWVRARLRLLGWKVRFMTAALMSGQKDRGGYGSDFLAVKPAAVGTVFGAA